MQISDSYNTLQYTNTNTNANTTIQQQYTANRVTDDTRSIRFADLKQLHLVIEFTFSRLKQNIGNY